MQIVKCRGAHGSIPRRGLALYRRPARGRPLLRLWGSGAPGPQAGREGAALPVPGGVSAGPALLRAPLVRGGGGRLSLAQVTEAGRTHELQPAESPHGDPSGPLGAHARPAPRPAPRRAAGPGRRCALYEETWERAGSGAALRGPAPAPGLRPGQGAGRPSGLIIAPSGCSVECLERGGQRGPGANRGRGRGQGQGLRPGAGQGRPGLELERGRGCEKPRRGHQLGAKPASPP